MRTCFLSLGFVLLVIGPVVADVLPPDPKPGMKRVRVVATVEVAAELPGYHLYRVWYDVGPTDGRGRPIRQPPSKPGSDKDDEPEFKPQHRSQRITFRPNVPWHYEYMLVAVPESARAKFDSGEAFADAINQQKVPSAHIVPIEWPSNEIPTSDPRTERKVRFVIERIDPEKGVIVTRTIDDPTAEATGTAGSAGNSATSAENWPLWVAGASVATGIVLLGVWLFRRGQ